MAVLGPGVRESVERRHAGGPGHCRFVATTRFRGPDRLHTPHTPHEEIKEYVGNIVWRMRVAWSDSNHLALITIDECIVSNLGDGSRYTSELTYVGIDVRRN